MRKFKVTLTYKSLALNKLISENIFTNKQKILDVELDDLNCVSPEEFCDAVLTQNERPEIVRLNVVEKKISTLKPLNWITENYGRIYFHNGIPLILNKN